VASGVEIHHDGPESQWCKWFHEVVFKWRLSKKHPVSEQSNHLYLRHRTVFGKHGNGTSGQRFGGLICEARFDSVARSSDWIQLSYQNQQPSDQLLTIYMAAPVLSLPANASPSQPISPTLSWNAVSGATSYGVQVSTDVFFGSLVSSQTGLGSTSASLSSLAPNTTYFWRASASDAGGSSNWGATWSFTTGVLASVPVLSSPTNGALNQPITISLAWGTSTNALSYGIRVSTGSDFATTVSSQASLTSSGSMVNGLINGMTYYWQANAVASLGASSWSNAWSFTTVLVPPTLSSPANNGSASAANLSLSWVGEPGVSSYAVQVSTASDFGSTIFGQAGLSATGIAVSGAVVGTTYYWEVNATGAGGTTAWSAVWSFQASALGTVVLKSVRPVQMFVTLDDDVAGRAARLFAN